jgi:hypothetical protein
MHNRPTPSRPCRLGICDSNSKQILTGATRLGQPARPAISRVQDGSSVTDDPPRLCIRERNGIETRTRRTSRLEVPTHSSIRGMQDDLKVSHSPTREPIHERHAVEIPIYPSRLRRSVRPAIVGM